MMGALHQQSPGFAGAAGRKRPENMKLFSIRCQSFPHPAGIFPAGRKATVEQCRDPPGEPAVLYDPALLSSQTYFMS